MKRRESKAEENFSKFIAYANSEENKKKRIRLLNDEYVKIFEEEVKEAKNGNRKR